MDNWLPDLEEFRMKHLTHLDKVEYWSPRRNIVREFARSIMDKVYEKAGNAPWWLNSPEFSHNTNIKIAYGTPAALTWTTLATLASDVNLLAGASSGYVDNSVNLNLDFLLGGQITTNTGSASTVSKDFYVYLYGSLDGTSSTWPDTIAGTDALKTITSANVLQGALAFFGSSVSDSATSRKYYIRTRAVSSAFGGVVPNYWGGFAVQSLGQAFSAQSFTATPIYQTA